MKRAEAWCTACLTCLIVFSGSLCLASSLVPSANVIHPMEQVPIPSMSFSDIAQLAPGVYALAGQRSTGEQPWETAPENVYVQDGAATYDPISGVGQGAMRCIIADQVEEVEVLTGGTAAGQDYGSGQGLVMNIVTKAGTNTFQGAVAFRMTETFDGLAYAQDGTLWGAGSDEDLAPFVARFTGSGTLEPVSHPLSTYRGFLYGIDFMGRQSGVVFGQTLPGEGPVYPLMARTDDLGKTWQDVSPLPWTMGTINTAHFANPLLGWVGGETSGGGAFAFTEDGGKTWSKQTMPRLAYVWDFEIASFDVVIEGVVQSQSVGVALGTYYPDEHRKESVVYRTLDGRTWEELWRIPGYGGAIDLDSLRTGEIAIVQNGLDGTATFSRYAAVDIFGPVPLLTDLEIVHENGSLEPGERVELRLAAQSPWGTIALNAGTWSADSGTISFDPDQPMRAIFDADQPGEVTITFTEPLSGRTSQVRLTVDPSEPCQGGASRAEFMLPEQELRIGLRYQFSALAWNAENEPCTLVEPAWVGDESLGLEPDGMQCWATPQEAGTFTIELWDGPPSLGMIPVVAQAITVPSSD